MAEVNSFTIEGVTFNKGDPFTVKYRLKKIWIDDRLPADYNEADHTFTAHFDGYVDYKQDSEWDDAEEDYVYFDTDEVAEVYCYIITRTGVKFNLWLPANCIVYDPIRDRKWVTKQLIKMHDE